jgi:hypothetical protein
MKCLECNKEFKAKNALHAHIKRYHECEQYYVKFFKKEGEGFCKICGKPTLFFHVDNGYRSCCSKECSTKYTYEQTKNGNLKKYNVENPYQRKDIKKKIKENNIKNFGVVMPLQNKNIKEKAYKTMENKYGAKTTLQSQTLSEKVKKTKKEKYGDEYYTNIEKIKETNIKKYGCENPLGNKKIREKRKRTMKKLYGSEHALKNKIFREKALIKNKQTLKEKYNVIHNMHIPGVFENWQKSCFRLKPYKNTALYYQASYEFDFLEKYINIFPEIQRGPSLKYKYEEKEKLYFPDFYIPSLNLIVEIKNSYLAKRDKDIILAKQTVAISNGYNFILIKDKDYREFECII